VARAKNSQRLPNKRGAKSGLKLRRFYLRKFATKGGYICESRELAGRSSAKAHRKKKATKKKRTILGVPGSQQRPGWVEVGLGVAGGEGKSQF